MLICRITCKSYIGKTTHIYPNNYVQWHKSKAVRGKNKNRYFYNAIRKHGWDNFDLVWLHYKCIHIDELYDLEQYYIQKYNTNDRDYGYNLTDGGAGSTGYKHTEKSRHKMSKSQKGNKNSLGERNANKRPEVRKKISEANKGRKKDPHSEKAKQEISKSQKGKPKKRITTEELKYIKLNYQAGMSYNQIGKDLNRAARHIKYIINKHNWQIDPM